MSLWSPKKQYWPSKFMLMSVLSCSYRNISQIELTFLRRTLIKNVLYWFLTEVKYLLLIKPHCFVLPATFYFFLPIQNNKVTVQEQLYQLYTFLMRNMRLCGKWWVFRPVKQTVHLLLTADHPAPMDADSASLLMLHFPSALGSSIHGDLLMWELNREMSFL